MELQKQVIIRYGTAEDMYQVTCLEWELARTHQGMMQYCKMSDDEHRKMKMAGLFRLLVAEAAGRIIGYLLYTPSHLLRYSEPGFYVQSLYVHPAYRRHHVGQSMMVILAKLACSSGFGHLKLLVQGSNEPAVKCYTRMGFQFLTESKDIGFFELWLPKSVSSTLRSGQRPLPPNLRLELRECESSLTGSETGRRFEFRSSECDCCLQGTVALTYCMWDGPVVQIDLESVRPSCPSRGCGLLNASSLRRLLGRLLLLCLRAPVGVRPVRLWLEANRKDFRLRQLLIKVGLEDSTASEMWQLCELRGLGVDDLASERSACECVGDLSRDAETLMEL